MGRYFLILNGCWLWVFCVSWKKLDKADVWACYCSSQFVESCVIQSDEALRASRTIGIFFFVGFSHKDKPKYPWWTKSFCGRLCCCLIAFVSRVQMSRVIVLVWGFIWCWLRAVIFSYHNREGFLAVWPFSDSCGEKYWLLFICMCCLVNLVWLCGTFRGARRPVETQKCFLLLDFSRLGALGPMKY